MLRWSPCTHNISHTYFYVYYYCLLLWAAPRWQKRRWKTEAWVCESWLVQAAGNKEYYTHHSISRMKEKTFKVLTHTHTCTLHTKVLGKPFYFSFCDMVFCLVLVILLFCITKFYTETLLDIIYVCWFRMKHRNGTEPHHTISMYANYLHKRELRFTIISVHRIHSISTLHGDDPLSYVQSWNTTTQSNEKYYSYTRQKKQQQPNIVQTEKFIKRFSIQYLRLEFFSMRQRMEK